MSKAYICDKCGRITESNEGFRQLWTVSPFVFSHDSPSCGDFSIDLCADCYAQFESEYMENKRENE